MTRMQIEYARLQETRRNNAVMEAIRDYEAKEGIKYSYAQLGESTRHNKATEGLQQQSVNENARHNQATERYNVQVLAESNRHNLETEQHNRNMLEESRRASIMSELFKSQQLQESERHNRAMERQAGNELTSLNLYRTAQILSQQQIEAQKDQTNQMYLAQKTAQEAADLVERERHNRAMEEKDFRDQQIDLWKLQNPTPSYRDNSIHISIDNQSSATGGTGYGGSANASAYGGSASAQATSRSEGAQTTVSVPTINNGNGGSNHGEQKQESQTTGERTTGVGGAGGSTLYYPWGSPAFEIDLRGGVGSASDNFWKRRN